MAVTQRGLSGTARVAGYLLEAIGEIEGVRAVALNPPPRPPVRGLRAAGRDALWDMWRAGRSEKLDLLVSPCNMGRAPRSIPHVLWIQDTMVLDHPSLFDRRYRLYAKVFFGPSARRATTVVTASNYAADCIRRRWRLDRVEVVEWPASGPSGVGATTVASGPRFGRRYVLMVAATEPHKNHVAAIRAVADLRSATGEDVQLRIVGPLGRSEPLVREASNEVDPSGLWITRETALSDEELHEAYRDAWILLQASLDEGFCLPVVEAAVRGLPVVHSGGGALSEVLPHSAAADPSPQALTAGMTRLLDPDLHRVARAAGLRMASERSWTEFQRNVQRVILDALG